MPRPSPQTRERLVAAATARFHEVGFANASLNDVARHAGVPAGNVFYHFRSKTDLARAVIAEWVRRIEAHLAGLDALPGPRERLEAFVEGALEGRAVYTTIGCPLIGLVRDLRHEPGAIQEELAGPYERQRAWLARQFAALGRATAAEDAEDLLQGYHGALLLAYAQADDRPLHLAVASLRGRLARLGAGATPPAA